MDDLLNILLHWIKQIEAQARGSLESYRIRQGDRTDELVLFFHNTLLAMKNNKTAKDKVAAIDEELEGKCDELINECQNYLGLTATKHLAWIEKPYKNKRHVILQLLDQLTIFSSTQDKSIEVALQFIQQHRRSRHEWIEVKEEKLGQSLGNKATT